MVKTLGEKMTPETKRILLVTTCTIIIYLILLFPYLVTTNSGESGIVIDSQMIDITTLPTDIQDLISYKDEQYYAILIVDATHNIKNQNGQISKEKKLVLSSQPAQKNEYIRVDNILINIFAPANLIPVADPTFDTLIIGDANRVAFGGIYEMCYNLKITQILVASQIVYLIGAFIVVLGLSIIYYKEIELWNIPALIACYSFQFFLASRIASANNLETDLSILLFGLMFLPALYIAFKVKECEVSENGKRHIARIYHKNIYIYTRAVSKIKETLNLT